MMSRITTKNVGNSKAISLVRAALLGSIFSSNIFILIMLPSNQRGAQPKMARTWTEGGGNSKGSSLTCLFGGESLAQPDWQR
jgi:hypothetical protein